MREPGQIKRAPRIAISQPVTLVEGNGTAIAATLTDVSSEGFRVRTAHSLPIGARVTLRGPRYGDVPAQIRWAIDGEAGGVFLSPPTL